MKQNLLESKTNYIRYKNATGDQEKPPMILSNETVTSPNHSGSFNFYRLEHSQNSSIDKGHDSDSSESMEAHF
jgi:hypothetical protein